MELILIGILGYIVGTHIWNVCTSVYAYIEKWRDDKQAIAKVNAYSLYREQSSEHAHATFAEFMDYYQTRRGE